MKRALTIQIRREDDAFWVTVEELPGVFATGDTLEELHASLSEGVALYLAAPGDPAPDVSISPLVETSTRVELAYA